MTFNTSTWISILIVCISLLNCVISLNIIIVAYILVYFLILCKLFIEDTDNPDISILPLFVGITIYLSILMCVGLIIYQNVQRKHRSQKRYNKYQTSWSDMILLLCIIRISSKGWVSGNIDSMLWISVIIWMIIRKSQNRIFVTDG
jgi:cytochrome b561